MDIMAQAGDFDISDGAIFRYSSVATIKHDVGVVKFKSFSQQTDINKVPGP